MSEYQLPKVWSAADSNQGKFSGINQPTAGARFEQTLPVGKEAWNSKWGQGDDYARGTAGSRGDRGNL